MKSMKIDRGKNRVQKSETKWNLGTFIFIPCVSLEIPTLQTQKNKIKIILHILFFNFCVCLHVNLLQWADKNWSHIHIFKKGCHCLLAEQWIPLTCNIPLSLYITTLLPAVRTGSEAESTDILISFLHSEHWSAFIERNISIIIRQDFSLICLQWKS